MQLSLVPVTFWVLAETQQAPNSLPDCPACTQSPQLLVLKREPSNSLSDGDRALIRGEFRLWFCYLLDGKLSPWVPQLVSWGSRISYHKL